jgi:hypothetical protein
VVEVVPERPPSRLSTLGRDLRGADRFDLQQRATPLPIRSAWTWAGQLALDGELPAGKASRMAYMLREARCAIESGTLERLEDRLAELAESAGVMKNGRPTNATPHRPQH